MPTMTTKTKTTAKPKKAKKKNPSPAQLRARKKFAAAAKARARAARAAKRAAKKATPKKRTAKKPAAKKAATPKKRNTTIIAKRVTVKRANPKAKAEKAAKKRNSAAYSSSTPIKVTQHFRSGGAGYMTARERIIRQGQRDLFSPKASTDELLGYLRRNPSVINAVKRKLGSEKFKTASNSLLTKTMRQVIAGVRGKKAAAKTKRNPARRRNSAESDLYQMFQGRSAGENYEMVAPSGTPSATWKLGDLAGVKLRDKADTVYTLRFDDAGKRRPELVADRDGNLHIVQTAPPDYQFTPDGNGDHVVEVSYVTAKAHIGSGELIEYYHEFGEEGGTPPRWFVDTEGLPIIKGGSYKIAAEGIRD